MRTILQLLGFGCFILIVIVSIDFAGFEAHHISNKRVLITDRNILYGVGAGLGLLGSLLLSAKTWKAALPAGIVTGLVFVAFTLFYLSFRSKFWNYEILLILLVGAIPYTMIYGFLSEKIYGIVTYKVDEATSE